MVMRAEELLRTRAASSQRAAAAALGIPVSTLRMWAKAAGIALASTSAQAATENARAAQLAYSRERRLAQRARIHERVEHELDRIESEQRIIHDAEERGDLLVYGFIEASNKDGTRLTIRAAPPDFTRQLQNIATTHGILQDKAEKDGEDQPDAAGVDAARAIAEGQERVAAVRMVAGGREASGGD